MKVSIAIEQLHESEEDLVELLDKAAGRHKADHDVHHMAESLASKARERVALLGAAAGDPGPVKKAREKASELIGRRPEPALLLLNDLRDIHVAACRCSIDWVVLAQAAQANRDEALLALVSERHPEALQVMKWTTTRIKQAAPQIFAGG